MLGSKISVKKAAIAGALAAGLLGAVSGTAHADGYVAHTYFRPISDIFLFLDVSGGATGDGAGLIQWPQSGENQAWYTQDVNGHKEIVNIHSGKCVTTDGVPGHQLYQWRCKGAPGQLWDINTVANAWYPGTIQNPASGLVMDVADASITAGAAVDAWYPNGGTNQQWSMITNL